MPRLGFAASAHAFQFDRPASGFGFHITPKVQRQANQRLLKAYEEWKAELDGSTHKALVAWHLLFILCDEGCDEDGSFCDDAEVLESVSGIHDMLWELHPEVETSEEQVQADLDDLIQRGWFLMEPWQEATASDRKQFRFRPGPSCPALELWMQLADLPATIR